jgi:hypothetical protein
VSEPQQRGKVRRPPSFPAFLGTGAVVGLMVGFVVSLVGPVDPRYDPLAALGFLGLICACLGLLVGGLIAVLLDRR